MHRGLMASVPIISIIGLLLILAGKKWTWVSPTTEINFAHSILGILTISSAFFQVFLNFQVKFLFIKSNSKCLSQ